MTQMPGKTALDSTTAIRYLNGDPAVVAKVISLPTIVLPVIVANVLLITAETYSKFINSRDRSVRTIFGDGAAATLIGSLESETELIGPFNGLRSGRVNEILMLRETPKEGKMMELTMRLSDEIVEELKQICSYLNILPEELIKQSITEYLQRWKFKTESEFEATGCGMWAGRTDMEDSVQWVSKLREQEWNRS